MSPQHVIQAPPGSAVDSALAADIRISIGRLARRLRSERDPELELGVGSISVLGVLYRQGEQTVGQLADCERVKPPSMTRTVAHLEGRGLVVRRVCTDDRRQVYVDLTDEGRRTLREDRRRREAWLARRVAELSPSDRAALRAAAPVLERLSAS